jgi:RHS repeat-associated protein
LLLDDGTYSYIYGPSSAPIAEVNDSTGTIRYLSTDLVGSTRLITSSTGSVVGVNIYDEYGNVTSQTGTATSPFGYSGNWTDPSSGLVYLRARDYDPKAAQFVTVDPFVDLTRQPYAYVADNPLDQTDSSGRIALLPGVGSSTWAKGGFKRLLQQELADRFDRLLEG